VCGHFALYFDGVFTSINLVYAEFCVGLILFCVDRKYDEVDARNWASAISIANCKMRSSALKALMHVDFMAFDH
jgi:hypothetical protein